MYVYAYISSCFNNCSQLKMSAVCLCMVGISCGIFYKQNIYIARANIPNYEFGKSHIPIVQQLEHSACNTGVMGLSPIRCVLCSTTWNFYCFKNCSQSKMGAVAHAWLAFCVNFYKKYIHTYIQIHDNYIMLKTLLSLSLRWLIH